MQVIAYLGDVSGDGVISSADATLASRVVVGTDTGFAAYQLLDPVIVGGAAAPMRRWDSADATIVNAVVAGTSKVQVPPVNPDHVTLEATGPDPVLSMPTDLQATAGSTVVVPVNIDTAKPDGSTGMAEAILALQYDPQVFSVSAADVQLGSLPASAGGWQLVTVVNAQTGEIGIDLYGTPIQTTAAGSLVTISLHVRDSAPAGSTGINLVNQVNPTGQRNFQTMVSDYQGAFVLHPAMTAAGVEPGSPGVVTVTGQPLVSSNVSMAMASVPGTGG